MSANPSLLSSLHWVQGELAQSLTRVRALIEQHMESPDDQLPLQQAVVELHQVRGTASMIQCSGLVALTDEMKLALQDLLQGRVAEPEPAYAALLGASVQLGDYIDALASGFDDSVLVFQPAINELRLARGKPVLGEPELFAEQQALAAVAVTLPPGETRRTGSAQAAARKFQLVFQQNLLQWMKVQDVQLALGRLGKVAEQVAGSATAAPVYQLWRMVAAVAEALLTKGLDDAAELKRLYGRAAAQLKVLADQGEEAAAVSAGTLPYQFLYYVARSRSQGPRVTALRNAYPLTRMLPTTEALEALRQKIRGPNTTLLTRLSEEIRNDLTQVKDTIDLVVRAGDKGPADLDSTVEKLNRVAVTLSMLGLSALQAAIQAQARVLAGIQPRATPAADPVWLDVATALLRVEHSLDDALFRQLRRARAEPGGASAGLETGIPNADAREGRGALLREMLVDVAKLKTLVDGYLKVGDAGVLPEGARLLGHLESSLHVLASERAAVLAGQLREYVGGPAFAGVRVERAQAERFADAIAAVEYYLEALQTRQPDADRLVDALATAVERLELGAPPQAAPATPARAAPPPPSMATDEVDPEIRDIFLAEADEVLGQLRENLPRAARDIANREAWTDVRRSFHTLKGSGRMVGARDIGEFAWSVENLLNRCLEGARPLGPPVIALVEAAIELLPGLIDGFRERRPVGDAALELQSRAHRMAKGDEGAPDQDVLQAFCADARARLAAVRAWLGTQDPAMSEFPIDDEVLRAVHTIRGSASLVNAQGIGGLAGEFEKYLNALRAARLRLPAAGLRLLADAEPEVGEWVERLAQGDVAEPDLKPWLRRLAEVQAALPAGLIEATALQDSADQFANEAFTRVEEIERALQAWSSHPEAPFHSRGLQDMFQTLRGDATTAQCAPLGRVAGAFQQRLAELAAGGFQPGAEFFSDAAGVIEGMYCQLDAFRDGALADDGAALAERVAHIGTSFAHTEDIAEIPPVAGGEPEAPPAGEIIETPVESLETGADPELVSVFLAEADELLENLDRQFATLESDPRGKAPLAEIARALHTLKGGARMAGLESIAAISHRLESLLDRVAQGHVARDTALHARLHNVMDGLYRVVEQAKRGETPDAAAVLAEIEGEAPGRPAAPAATAPPSPPPAAASASTAPVAPAAGFDAELAQVFTAEAAELIESLESSLAAWQADAGNEEALREMQRALHTLKGGARMSGALAMGTLAHEMESRVEEIAESTGPVDATVLGSLHSALEQLQRMQDQLARGETAAMPVPPAGAAAPAVEPQVEQYPEPAAPAPAPAARGPWDPALFWRPEDAREGMAARQRETARVVVDQLDKMLNEAGEISIYRARLEQHNSALQFQLDEMQQTLERVREHLRALDIETETQIAARGFSQGLELDRDKRSEFDPLEMDRYSRMQELSRTLSESVGDLAALRATMDEQLSEAGTLLMQQGRVNTEVQQGLMSTLMVPFSRQVQRLQRVARQTAQEAGKQVEVRFEGVEQELDRNVLERMVAPLEHLLRNCVVHGVEAPEQRRAAGKAEAGAIHVGLHREGTQLAIEVRDDGQGLNYAAIRKTAIERGLMAADATLRDPEVAMFIFEAGFSTAREITQAAGRGVGMDVVASEVKQLGGTLELSSEAGQGARFVIRLPLTLALSQALLVGVGSEAYAVPLPAIESIARVPRDKLPDHLREGGPLLTYGGQEYRVQSLAELLEVPHHRPPEDARTLPAVLVRLGEGLTGGERRVALVVDTLFGNREIISKAVGPQVSSVQGVSGATILPDGRVVLIVDAPALVANRARRAAVEAAHPAEVAAAPLADERPTVMVVDDSITIRRVTERLLERAGYRVVLAKDGLDAMTQLQAELPAAMLLDIEMPRADGFEVAAFVRNNERLKAVPIIMITSRSGEKHRERARQLGVNRYVIKPYQEEDLLAEVRDMVRSA